MADDHSTLTNRNPDKITPVMRANIDRWFGRFAQSEDVIACGRDSGRLAVGAAE